MSYPAGSKRKQMGADGKRPHPEGVKAHDQHTDGMSGNTAYQPGQGEVTFGTQKFNKFPSDNIPANAFGISTQFDTRWPGALVDSLRETSMEITIQNPSLLLASLVDPSVWFPRMEVLSNGANTDIVLYDIMYYVDKESTISDEERAQFAYGNIYNPNTARLDTGVGAPYSFHNYEPSTTFSIVAGGTLTIYAKYKTFLTDSKFFFPSSSVEPRIRVYTGNNIQTTTSLAFASTMTLISVNTFLRGVGYDSDVRRNLTQKYLQRTSITRCIVYERQTFSLLITSAQETTDSLLTALTGRYAWLMVILSQASPTQDNLYSSYASRDIVNGPYWKRLQDITLLDSNQNPWQFVKIPVPYLKNEVWGDHWRSALQLEKQIVCIPFSTCCQASRMRGADLGSKFLDGNWTLRFTPIQDAIDVITPGMAAELIVLGARCALFSQTPGGGVNFRRLS